MASTMVLHFAYTSTETRRSKKHCERREITQHVSPVEGYKGGLGEPFSFMCVTVPECLPESLEVISYANEYAFLYDGL